MDSVYKKSKLNLEITFSERTIQPYSFVVISLYVLYPQSLTYLLTIAHAHTQLLTPSDLIYVLYYYYLYYIIL